MYRYACTVAILTVDRLQVDSGLIATLIRLQVDSGLIATLIRLQVDSGRLTADLTSHVRLVHELLDLAATLWGRPH